MNSTRHARNLMLCVAMAALPAAGLASEQAGTFKVVNGTVHIERDGQQQPARVGTAVEKGDRVVTAARSFAGITLLDNTRLTASPDSVLVIDDFSFDTTTHEGRINASLKRGTLSVISGQLAKSNPDSVTYNTGTMTIGVRGTTFILEAAGE